MLYIVGTPIGNLNDLSYRQAKTLSECDVILVEDTRSYPALIAKMLDLFSLRPKEEQKLISYYKEREFEKLPEIFSLLQEDKNVALISDSGMPLISDPGFLLVKELIKRNLQFDVIPGPTAVTTALALSGFNPKNFTFVGFLPKKDADLRKTINLLMKLSTIRKDMVYIAYESPQRVNKTLHLMNELAPECDLAVCRELTKKFQEVSRGKPAELLDKEFRGEITLVFSF